VSACVSHGKDIPLLPYMEGLRQYYGITDGDSVQTCQDKITGRMMRLDAGLADEVPFMLDFLGVPDRGRPVQDMAPEARTRRLLELLRAQRAVRGRESVFVYVVEDLHWSDPATHAITEGYCKSLGATSTLVVLTFRPEYRADWAPSHVYEQIALRPLDAASIRVLLETILGPAAVEQGLAERIHARTGGNPFFIEEVVESLVEAGALEGTRGAYRLTRPVDELVVPDTVQAVLAARIDRLDGGAKSVLQTASVIDKTVPLAILRRIAGVPDRELDGALQVLADAAFVYEEAVRPDVVYGFKHPLTQEVAYGSLLKDRRQQLHGELARVLEGHHADRLDENAALIAHHYESAGEALAAARWHRRAAEWVGRTDLAAATRHWRSVRALRREVPDDVEAAALGIAACRQLLQNMTFRVAVDLDARAVFEEGLALANAVDNHREALYLSMSYSRVLGGDGDVAQNLDLAVKNHRAALEMDDVAVRANAATYLVDVLNVSGQLAQVLEVADTEIARVPRRLPREEWLWGFNHQTLLRILRAFAVTWTGGLREALEEFVHVLRLAEEDGTPEMAGYAFFYTAEAQYQAGDAAGVLASARRIEAISHARPEHLGLFAHTQQAFGLAHLAAGRAAEAAESFRTALDHHQRVDKAYAGKAACYLAEAWLQAGDLSAAQGGAEEAIALCRRSLRAVYEAIAHGVMARALLRRDGAAARDAAEAALASAAALIERTGAKTLAPALCEWRAELSAVLGDGTTREQRLRQALQGYADIGAPAHAARLAREPFASSPLR
jgi:adenylate cyclase